MQKINKLQLVTIALSLLLVLSGCGMIPVAGLLVDNHSPSIFLVNSDNYPGIKTNLSKKVNLVNKPEQAEFLVYILASPVSVTVDIIAKNGLANEANYQPITGNISPLIVSGIARTIQFMPCRPIPAKSQEEISI
jgi:hypothetical protein